MVGGLCYCRLANLALAGGGAWIATGLLIRLAQGAPNTSVENLTADEARQRAAAIQQPGRGEFAIALADKPSILWSGALAVEALPTPWARRGRCQDPR
ncbi:MAG: hypothetical protein GDA40_11885 [Rhodobacteraceae bacterium]|nr:hypothetical protein [Paracoccaceae bacterium]